MARPDPNRQKTRPKKGKPFDIPIPTREEVMRDLAKVAPPPREPSDGGSDRDGAEDEGREHRAP